MGRPFGSRLVIKDWRTELVFIFLFIGILIFALILLLTRFDFNPGLLVILIASIALLSYAAFAILRIESSAHQTPGSSSSPGTRKGGNAI